MNAMETVQTRLTKQKVSICIQNLRYIFQLTHSLKHIYLKEDFHYRAFRDQWIIRKY